jgi:hypothetical protein
MNAGRCERGGGSVAWDGRDGAGRAVSSGIVLYRVVAGSAEASGRIVLIR